MVLPWPSVLSGRLAATPFYGEFDIPSNVEVLSSSGDIESTPELKTIWNLGVRLIFDWRHYF